MVEGPTRRHRAHTRRGDDRPGRRCRWSSSGRRSPRSLDRRLAGAHHSSGRGCCCSGRWCSCSSRPGSGSSTTSDRMRIRTGSWITPGAVAATILWLWSRCSSRSTSPTSPTTKARTARVGGVIVVLLWFYVSGIAILTGAELNAEIEHASPYGKAPGQKNAQGKLLIGARAARAFRQRQPSGELVPVNACSIDAAATAEARIGCGGCGRDLDDEVVESAC